MQAGTSELLHSDNVSVDRAGASKFPIRKRTIPRFGRLVWSLFGRVVVCAHGYATKLMVVPHCPFPTN
jgi:hypothetical protein